MNLADRLPPHDRDAERAVLGAILRDPDILPDVQAIVREESFYLDPHRQCFAAIAELNSSGSPIDLVGINDTLRKRGKIEDVGGVAYIAELWDAVATGASATYHASLVRDAALLRSLIHVTNEILRDAYSPVSSAAELLAAAERKLYAIAADAHGDTDTARHVGEVAREVLQSIDDRIASGGTLAGLSTGYPDLDDVLGGLRPGELIVLGARPSLGKTALSLNFADHIARGGEAVLFVSLEMPAKDITERLLSMGSHVPMHLLSRPRELTADDIDALYKAGSLQGVAGSPIFVDDAPEQTAARIASVARRMVRKHGVQLVVVDHLGLMKPENPRDNRTQQIGTLAERMKQMARSLGIPVILLSQLNREQERQNRKPRLSDLRESGDIEAHADRVILLHREADLPADDREWPIDLIVAKNRNGPVGDVRLMYRRPVMRFENAAIGLRRAG